MIRNPGDGDLTGEAFWRFSLALYARPGVADALIALQDRAARDVNLILFGLWLGVSRGRRLAGAELAAVEAATAELADAAVAPLRRLRRQIKVTADPDLQALRRRVAALEIAAERRVQFRLAALVSDASATHPEADGWVAAQANLVLTLGTETGTAEAGVLCRALASMMRRA
jgi:uncharacterized protein (TIGR02444 family)